MMTLLSDKKKENLIFVAVKNFLVSILFVIYVVTNRAETVLLFTAERMQKIEKRGSVL